MESWHCTKEDLQKNWTPVPGYEPDPVIQVTGFVYELKLSLMMQQIPGNYPLKIQDGPPCFPGAQ